MICDFFKVDITEKICNYLMTERTVIKNGKLY